MPRALTHPRLLRDLSDFYPSLCTIQEATETQDGFGEVDETWSGVVALTNLPCVLAPLGMGSPERQEVRRPDGTIEVATHHASIAGRFPEITPKMRAVVDGGTYAILGVDMDSQRRTTRLRLEVVQ